LDNDRNVVENQLIYDSDCDDVDSVYTIDFDDLEEKFKDPKTKLMILCNPHNPIGKIWEKGDLEKIAVLAKRHDVIVVSDEIHCDLTDPDLAYVPFASLDEELSKNSITCISPSKTFNIAGLQSSAVFTRNKELYEVLEKQLAVDCFNHPNIFSIDATISAYKSEEWLNELREVLFENKMIVDEFLKSEIPEIRLVPANATYLLWLDCSKLNMDGCDGEFSNDLSEFLREEVGLFLSPGVQFGQNGDNFLRMNIACPQELLLEGLNALKIGIEKYKNK
jgi:cystathionine beta-lyase